MSRPHAGALGIEDRGFADSSRSRFVPVDYFEFGSDSRVCCRDARKSERLTIQNRGVDRHGDPSDHVTVGKQLATVKTVGRQADHDAHEPRAHLALCRSSLPRSDWMSCACGFRAAALPSW